MPERYYFVLNYPANPVRLAGASNCIPAWVGLLPSPAPSIFYSAPNGFLFGLSFPVLFAAFKPKAKSRPFFASIPQPKQRWALFLNRSYIRFYLMAWCGFFARCFLFPSTLHGINLAHVPQLASTLCALGLWFLTLLFEFHVSTATQSPCLKCLLGLVHTGLVNLLTKAGRFLSFFQKKLPHRWAVNPWHRKVDVRRSQPSTLWRYMGFAPVLQIAAQGRQIRALFYTPKGVLFDLPYPLSG